MATPLDIGILKYFGALFPFLLVLVIVYAVLVKSPWFSDNKAFAGIIAFVLALLTMFSRVATKTISMMAPWFVILVIFGILFILAYMAFGIKEDTIMGVLTGQRYGSSFAWWIIAIMLIIGLGSLFTVISQEQGFTQLTEEGEVAATEVSGEEAGFWAIIFHPKVLGIAVILLIAMFTISKLAGKTE